MKDNNEALIILMTVMLAIVVLFVVADLAATRNSFQREYYGECRALGYDEVEIEYHGFLSKNFTATCIAYTKEFIVEK